MNNKTIVLLTNQFPYNTETGEIYLNIEIDYLSQVYDKVIICPTDVNVDERLNLFKDKDNIKIIVKQKRSRKKNKMLYFLKSIIYFLSLNYRKMDEMLKMEYSNQKNLKNKLFFYYFCIKARDKYLLYINDIEKEIDQLDKVLIYSYRLFDIAYMGILINDKICCENKRVISRAHGYDLYEYSNKLKYLPARLFLYNKMDYILPCSKDGANYLIEDGCSNKKVIYTYLGSVKTKYIKENGGKIFNLISVSSNKPVKRVELIIEVIKMLSKKYHVKWTHIGGNVEKFIEENKCYIDQGIMNFMGPKDHLEVLNIMSNSYYDLFINLSSSEGLPQSIMEAFSYGIPCIATDVGGTREIVDESNGFLVNSDFEIYEVVDKIGKYIELDKEEKEEYRKNAYYKWNELFNAENNAEEFAKHYVNF